LYGQIPTLTDREVTIYLRIAAALVADIESGPLSRGEPLPTHRAPVKALKSCEAKISHRFHPKFRWSHLGEFLFYQGEQLMSRARSEEI
jgi:hypothetical protein